MVEAASAKLIRRAIIIGALGYFIDMLDIQIFAVLRVPSLTEMGVEKNQLARIGGNILTIQMLGMILGGFLWGWIGDRFGRLKALYGSILIYSIGTLLCSIVHEPTTYGLYRFISGFGLAGETGAAVTLIAELMPPRNRGWGIIMIAGFGFLGPVTAVCLSLWLNWRSVYIIAGLLGLLLLIVRKTLAEPAMFTNSPTQLALRGSWQLLKNRKSLLSLLVCLMIAVSSTYGWSILNFFSAEFSRLALKDGQIFNQKMALLSFFLGTVLGDGLSGVLTQYWQSRRKALAALLISNLLLSCLFLLGAPLIKISSVEFYICYAVLGISFGYLVLITTIAAENFGINIRATTALIITNLNRGLTIPLVFCLQQIQTIMSINNAAAIMIIVIAPISLLAVWRLKETHGTDLDYLETI